MASEDTVRKSLSLIKYAYLNSFKNMDISDMNGLLRLWLFEFKDDDDNQLANAVNIFITTDLSGFPPTIAQIKHLIYKENAKDSNELWLEYRRALTRVGFNMDDARKLHATLSAELQEYFTPYDLWEVSTMQGGGEYSEKFVKPKFEKYLKQKADTNTNLMITSSEKKLIE